MYFYPMKKWTAFIFDLNGTMIDDMEYHINGWFDVLNNELHAGLSREQVRSHMYGKHEELLDRVFGKGHFSKAEADRIAFRKESRYQEVFLPHLKLIAGLPALLEKARVSGIRMAIGSAATPFNIDYVLDNLKIRHYFDIIVSADDVEVSKPNPEVFLKAAAGLGADPASCLVFEDSPRGVEAASNAGMKSVALTTMHTREEFPDDPGILHFIHDYTDPTLAELFS